MKKHFALIAVLLFAFSLGSAGDAVAKDATSRFEYHVGDAFLQGLGFPVADVSRGANGDTVEVIATGEIRVNGRKAEGTGSFAHKNAAGTTLAVGSFTAERLRSFKDFGTQADVPSTFHGGMAVILVHVVAHPASDLTATVKFDAVLTIDCALGDFPAGFTEGITFVIENGPFAGFAFDQKVSGVNVFIAGAEKD